MISRRLSVFQSQRKFRCKNIGPVNGPAWMDRHYFECLGDPGSKLARSLEFVTDDFGGCVAARSLALHINATREHICFPASHLGTPGGD